MGDPASEQGVRQAALPLSQALALGLLHGPTELLPISSSAHTILVPWLAGWSFPELDPELRQSFEVALHAGTALALLLGSGRDSQNDLPRARAPRRLMLAALGLPALVGYTLERQIAGEAGDPQRVAW